MKRSRKIKKDNVGGLRDRLEMMDIGIDNDDSGMGLIMILVIIFVIIAMIIAVMLGVLLAGVIMMTASVIGFSLI